jgi:transketolase
LVLNIVDVNNLNQVERIIKIAQSKSDKPILVITRTHIGFGSPNKQDKSSSHGAPLGEEEVKLTKRNLGMPEDKTFFVTDEVYSHFKGVAECGQEAEDLWNNMLDDYKEKYPNDYNLFDSVMSGKLSAEWINHLPKFEDYTESVATRVASGKVLNAAVIDIPNLIGGSADLNESNMTHIKSSASFSAKDRTGKNIHFGIREHAMGSILNGMAMYGGVIPFGATFLIFSDYLRPTLRLASLSKVKTILVFTHDSIGLGEDGPTHQPVEQISSLRAIPGVVVIRPADANETVEAWKFAIQHKDSPVALILTRQKLPVLDQNKFGLSNGLLQGAYILKDSNGTPDLILIATGSEVHLAIKSTEKLEAENINVRVVSFPSWELFENQPEEYKQKIFPVDVKARISIEAGVSMGWKKYVGDSGEMISIEKFGASAPDKILFEQYGFTVENVVKTARRFLK